MNYKEDIFDALETKQEYVSGFEKLIERRQKECENVRNEYIEDVFSDGEKYRSEFKAMLGWPLIDFTPERLPEVKAVKLAEENGYEVYRMQFEILDGLKMCGLFFKSQAEEPKPLVVVQHGGLGTPELISGFYGSTENYNDMLERVIKHGVHAFAPQLLLWAERFGAKYSRASVDARLKRLGGSVTAVEVFGITRILDYFEAQDYVSDFGMVGLSYGGFYTLFTAAIDTRIKSSVSCSFFNTRDRYPWIDWTWFNAAKKFDDAEIACLVYPRRLCIEIGDKDELFAGDSGKSSYEKLKNYCKDIGTKWLDFIIFDGRHEFCKLDEPIKRLISDIS